MVAGEDGHMLCTSVIASVVGGRHDIVLLSGPKIGVDEAVAATELCWDDSRGNASAYSKRCVILRCWMTG